MLVARSHLFVFSKLNQLPALSVVALCIIKIHTHTQREHGRFYTLCGCDTICYKYDKRLDDIRNTL